MRDPLDCQGRVFLDSLFIQDFIGNRNALLTDASSFWLVSGRFRLMLKRCLQTLVRFFIEKFKFKLILARI